MKTITFMGKELPVLNTPYAYIQQDGHVVLKLEFAESDTLGFDEIKELTDNTGVIVYKEDGATKNEFENYTCGMDGFICNYSNANYSVELRRKSALDVAVEKLDEATTNTELAIAEMYEMILMYQM